MTALLRKSMLASLALAAALSLQIEAGAADSLFNFGLGGSSRKDSNSRIEADSMDIDLSNNVATLIGNVFVDDADATIRCHKMIIYLEDPKAEVGNASGKPAKVEDEGPDMETSKKLKRVECIGDVVITRKAKAASANSAPQAEQKALAGHADYDASSGLIVLSEDPVVFNGNDVVKGKKIKYDREGRINIEGGTLITGQSGKTSSDSAAKHSAPSASK